jgi:hypothetical protein
MSATIRNLLCSAAVLGMSGMAFGQCDLSTSPSNPAYVDTAFDNATVADANGGWNVTPAVFGEMGSHAIGDTVIFNGVVGALSALVLVPLCCLLLLLAYRRRKSDKVQPEELEDEEFGAKGTPEEKEAHALKERIGAGNNFALMTIISLLVSIPVAILHPRRCRLRHHLHQYHLMLKIISN